MLFTELDCLMSWKFPAVQSMGVAQDAGRGHLARWSECGWSPELGPQPGFSTPTGGVITSFLPLLHKTNPQSCPLAQQGQGLQTSGRVAGAEAALERREPRPGLTVGFDTRLAI